MIKIINLAILTLGITCSVTGQQNIRFGFKAVKLNKPVPAFEIYATLYNDQKDTVCFLTGTCQGEQRSLRYDKLKFRWFPYILCNVNYLKLIKIPPKSKYEFKAEFRYNTDESTIKLGFDFYEVDKSFDIKGKTIGDLMVFNRPAAEQTIIWAKEKEIQQ